ncbi:aspartyl-phosphate phosphatase Spo0E family protein [Heyndrickxia acidicola]|uniref:aspartyl-phosphate phosphatase Spo0E family protein n=1 Tax=Heyndrickxia acidicola TaxID=209389 RepID=UPI000826AB63
MTILRETVKFKNQIFDLKQKLIYSEKETGYTHPKTIKYSNKLDKLIHRFQSLTKNKFEAS